MHALLLYPEFDATFWSFKHALRFIRKRACQPPLGLLTVAALLPARWETRLVDTNVGALSQDDLDWADVVLVGAMLAQRRSARALLARCRAAGKTIVAGGPLFSAEHRSFPEVDHFVLGEAELTLPPFLDDFQQGRAQRLYRPRGHPALTRTPVPIWTLLDTDRYASMSIQYSRGCPFDCEFCDITATFGRRPRTKTPAQVIAELDGLWALGWRGSVFVVDDNFIGNKRRLRESLLPALIQWQGNRRRFTFYTEASINLADDPELMHMMVAAGFDTVFIGIETPRPGSSHDFRAPNAKGRNRAPCQDSVSAPVVTRSSVARRSMVDSSGLYSR